MKSSSTSTTFKNLQNFGDVKIDIVPGTAVLDVIRVIAKLTKFDINQIDIVTITFEEGNPLSVLSPRGIFPSIPIIESTVYYYFLKPLRRKQRFVKVNTTTRHLVVPPVFGADASTSFPSFGGRTLGSGFNKFTYDSIPIGTAIPTKKPDEEPAKGFPGIKFSVPIHRTPPPSPLGEGVKGKEKEQLSFKTSSPTTEERVPTLYQTWGRPLPPNMDPRAWSRPVFMQKLQLLSKTKEFLLSKKPYTSTDILVYYHSDLEKTTILNLLGDPIRIENESSSSQSKINSDVYHYLTVLHELIIPLTVRFLKTSGIERIDPILLVPGIPNYLTNLVKISISPDRNAVQLTPTDYSSSVVLYNSILWLLVNHPGFSLPSLNLEPPSYVPSPPYSPSDSPPRKLRIPNFGKRLIPITDYIPIP